MIHFNYYYVYIYAGYILSKCFSYVFHMRTRLAGEKLINSEANVLDSGVFVKNTDESKKICTYICL